MRVISGSLRGRPLRAPMRSSLRPTSDRVREAMFDIVGSLGGVEGADVLDLFAGTGALGIEAISRGAEHVTFVENDRTALAAIAANLHSTGLAGDPETSGNYRVVPAEALGWLAGNRVRFDVAFCDPPYRFERWPQLLDGLRAELVVLESDRELELPESMVPHRVYRYGGTLVTLAKARHTSRGEDPHGADSKGEA